MFCKLGFDRFQSKLSIQEHVKLLCISKYLDFKIGEIWTELTSELYFENIRPVTPDQDCIDTVALEIKTKAQTIQSKQNEYIQRQLEEEHNKEVEFLNDFQDEQSRQKANMRYAYLSLANASSWAP